MSDVMLNPEAPTSPEHVAIYRKDYRPPDWLVPEVALEFELDPGADAGPLDARRDAQRRT